MKAVFMLIAFLPLAFLPLPCKAQSGGNSTSGEPQWRLESSENDYFVKWFDPDSSIFSYDRLGLNDTEIYFYYYDSIWKYEAALFQTFNNLGSLTYYLQVRWDYVTGKWENQFDETHILDGGNRLTQTVEREWQPLNGSWLNEVSDLYTYDKRNNLTTFTSQTWDTAAKTWISNEQYIYTYDKNNAVLTDVNQEFNSFLGRWVPGNRNLYTNDSHGNHLIDLLQVFVDTGWQSISQTTYTYDADNNMTQELRQIRNTGDTMWRNYDLLDYAYNENNQNTLTVSSNWSNSEEWISGYKYITTYSDTLETGYIYQEWEDTVWQNISGTGYKYDVNNNQIYELDQQFDPTGDTFTNYEEIFYHYKQLNVVTPGTNLDELQLSLYPNLSSGENMTLVTNIAVNAPVRIGLFDALGRLLNTATYQFIAGVNNTVLNYPNLSRGEYYIQVIDYTTGKSGVAKFVKE